jgi:hypothetical protein
MHFSLLVTTLLVTVAAAAPKEEDKRQDNVRPRKFDFSNLLVHSIAVDN